jgi:glyoxylase-like metal-dependent hydrolase (beta-lactamase superfamily II)
MSLEKPICIDLDQPQLEGFRRFISAWIYRWQGKTFLVDPGPLSTIPALLAALARHQVEKLDYILLTHIHIDHAGGTGELLRFFPAARVICHPEGIRHLVVPEKLWQGSLKVLGPVAEAYGEIVAVPADNITFEEHPGGACAYLTPGHAAHHCCYLIGNILFAGEVAGVRCEVSRGIYMRPATPPRFFLDVALASVERMLTLQPEGMVFGHYGLVDKAMKHLRIGRNQLLLWVQGVIATAGIEPSRREAAFFDWLLERDACFGNIDQLEPDIRRREQVFLKNTLAGMRGYVAGLAEEERKAIAGR